MATKRTLVFFLFTIMILPVNKSLAQEQLSKFTKFETYGVGTSKEDGTYPVIAFIPRTFLLFEIDYEEPDLKVGNQYLAATTQDGVRVYMLEKAVSKVDFKDAYGEQDIIFNADYRACMTSPACDIDNDDETLRIRAGEVFTAGEPLSEGSDIIKLVGNRGNSRNPVLIECYISRTKLDELNKKAKVTYGSLKHPHYRVEKVESSILNTKCGDRVNEGDEHTYNEIAETDRRIIEGLELGMITISDDGSVKVTFKKSYGAEGKEVVYRLYGATDTRKEPEKTETYIVQVTFVCEKEVFEIRKRIEKVALCNIDTGRRIILDSEGTPANLAEFTGAPYLFSINSDAHYYNIMDHLTDNFPDRAIAGYFLAEFNRSCKGRFRKKEKDCQHGGY